MMGISKLPGKLETPLIPKFLKCKECGLNMTSYRHKRVGNYYYKCNRCSHAVNADSTKRAWNPGLHEMFGELLDRFKMKPQLIPMLRDQVTLVLKESLDTFEEQRRDIDSQIKVKEQQLERMEHRYVIGELNESIWLKHSSIVKEEVDQLVEKAKALPSKKSNLAILDDRIIELLQNPRQCWESLGTKHKRRLQEVLFPEGLWYAPKTREYLTSNIHLLLEITGCFIETWTSEKNKTRRQNVFGSRVVAGAGLEPTTFGL